jgi:hypothetical protein
MRTYLVTVTAALALLSIDAIATTQSVAACLVKPNAVDCMAISAFRRLESLPESEDKVEGYSALLTAMVSAKYRNDEIFRASRSVRNGTSLAVQTWILLLARQNYAVTFRVPINDPTELELLMYLTEPTRRIAGDKIYAMVIQACESYRTGPRGAFKSWLEFLQQQCSLSGAEIEASDAETIGLVNLALPLIFAYRGDQDATREAVSLSRRTIEYFRSLAAQLPPTGKNRDNLKRQVFIGHSINATALALSKQSDLARVELDIALKAVRKTKRLMSDPEFAASTSYVSWAMAELGPSNEAQRQIEDILKSVDRKGFMSVKEQADAIVGCIEAVQMRRAAPSN